MKFKFFLYVSGLLFFISCGGGKTVIGSEKANHSLSTKDIIKTHNSALPEFNTIAARMHVLYKNGDDMQSLTVSMRMEKDQKIWIKASLIGITLAKLYITPESVSFYETISNTYFDGDFSLLSNWLGIEIDFQKAQSILLGQTIFDLDLKYKSEVITNKYRLQPKQQPQNFIHSLLINPDNFKIDYETLSQPSDNRTFTINYGSYNKLKGGFYPSEIKITATQKEEETKIEVKYKKIDYNVSIRFPFNIPNGYKEIELD
ncbi:MAG: deoxyuridine 5'-triphosphate nucleotidohydrolase [Flavobacterium sp.]|nr:MAG: deoxyuridine 5'-triphosphate nucleotidohydrolase [Flavobacterium sp.]